MSMVGYEITTMTVIVHMDPWGADGPQTFTMTAPPGKVPISAGFNNLGPYPHWLGSYPSGNDWVFVFAGQPYDETSCDLYLISADA